MQSKYNNIGDIHGRSCWKQVIRDGYINIFVGDYFDPYALRMTFEQCLQNFLEILAYKIAHPETILLFGNHDYHYIFRNQINENYSRYDFAHAEQIQRLFLDNIHLFYGIAYSINNQYLVSHAGVSVYWFTQWITKYNGQSPNEVANLINMLWLNKPEAFAIRNNMRFDRGNQEGIHQSPIWLRSYILPRCNIFEGTPYIQVFGHTQCNHVWQLDERRLICVDCLGNDSIGRPVESYLIESTNNTILI